MHSKFENVSRIGNIGTSRTFTVASLPLLVTQVNLSHCTALDDKHGILSKCNATV